MSREKEYKKYVHEGKDVFQILSELIEDNTKVSSIKKLREIFPEFSLTQAKGVLVIHDADYESLNEYQKEIFEQLEKCLQMVEVIKKQWNYTLSKNLMDEYILSVVCGTAGLYDIEIVLNDKQITEFKKRGEAYIDDLAQIIRDNPSDYLN